MEARHYNITKYLDFAKYDYLRLPVGDGVADDGKILQARIFAAKTNEGIYPYKGLQGTKFMIRSTMYL